MTPDRCTRCDATRPKHGRWFWINSNAKPPVVYCPPCAEVVVPDRVAARRLWRRSSGRQP